MTKGSAGMSLVFLILFLPFVLGCAAKRKSPLDVPEGSAGLIAYGSLMSRVSMEESLKRKYDGPAYEVHLTGYERVWACVRPWRDPQAAAGGGQVDGYLMKGAERVPIFGAAELDLNAKKGSRTNGVLYFMTDEDLRRLDDRERGYRRVDVTDNVEEFRVRGGKVYVYRSLPRSRPLPPAANGAYILIKEFLAGVLDACDARGTSFRAEFDRSTKPCEFPVVALKDIIWAKAE
jgi:hypothetical protein